MSITTEPDVRTTGTFGTVGTVASGITGTGVMYAITNGKNNRNPIEKAMRTKLRFVIRRSCGNGRFANRLAFGPNGAESPETPFRSFILYRPLFRHAIRIRIIAGAAITNTIAKNHSIGPGTEPGLIVMSSIPTIISIYKSTEPNADVRTI